MSTPADACPAYLGLGSNLQQPLRQVEEAVVEIDALPQTRVVKKSSWYRSVAVGPGDQPDYINGVLQIETALSPDVLLQKLQQIESSHGRERRIRWGARTLDLDILLYDQREITTPQLTVPHPQLGERNFVLYPLAEIDPELNLPDGRPLKILLANVSPQGIVRLSSSETASE